MGVCSSTVDEADLFDFDCTCVGIITIIVVLNMWYLSMFVVCV